MNPLTAFFRRSSGSSLTGSALGEAAAFAAGQATAPVLEPALQEVKNQAWQAVARGSKGATRPLPNDVIARSIHRGIMKDTQNLLPVGPPSEVGKIKAFPVSTIDPLDEAEKNGYNLERLFVETAIVGLPMGPIEAAHANFRGILEDVDYNRAISEGNVRNEWGEAIKDYARQIPTAHEYVEAQLRGWITKDAMYAGTARHGMSKADTDLTWEVAGRPAAHNQVFIGKLRGGTYNGPIDKIDPDYLTSLRHSNIRPEYYNLLWAQRYHYPGFFQVVNMLNKGFIDAPTATDWLTIQGYEPGAIATVVSSVTGKGTKPTKTLTAAQVKAGFKSSKIDRPTALQRIEADGYSAADAAIYLDS